MNHRLDNLTDCDGLIKHHQTLSSTWLYRLTPLSPLRLEHFLSISTASTGQRGTC